MQLKVLVFDRFIPSAYAICINADILGEIPMTTLVLVDAQPVHTDDLEVLLSTWNTLETADIQVSGYKWAWGCEEDSIAELLRSNPNLTALHLVYDRLSAEACFKEVGELAKNLQYLDISRCIEVHIFFPDDKSIQSLIPVAHHLLELSIEPDLMRYEQYQELLRHCSSLQALHADLVYLRHKLDSLLVPCVNLTYLGLSRCRLSKRELVDIVNNLPALRKLCIRPYRDFHIDTAQLQRPGLHVVCGKKVCTDTPYWR